MTIPHIAPGAYVVATHPSWTADQASAGLFPEHARVVCVERRYVCPVTVKWTFIVDYPDEAVPA